VKWVNQKNIISSGELFQSTLAFTVVIQSFLRQFWQSQIHQIHNGGSSVVTRKLKSLRKVLARRLLVLICFLAAAPLVFLIVAVRPFLHLRFGTMVSQRIGHFAIDVEAYLCAREQKIPSYNNIIDIIGCPEPICNRQLHLMWARTLHITPGARFWHFVDLACQFWTRGVAHHVQLYDRREDYNLIWTSEQHLRFSSEEHQRGRELLEQLGIPAGAPWICIHNRDSTYLDKALGGQWAYHDYRDFSIHTMISAAEELILRGYYVIRIGSIVAEKIISDNTKLIDYASSSLRSDFGDIYLSAECSAFICSDAGISCVPYIFHKPVSYVNYSGTLLDNFIERDTYPFIIKRLWHNKMQRFLSLREMFDAGLVGAAESHLFKQIGVEPICNTSEDIRDLAIEVDERLKGLWQPQPGDEALQQQFWDIYGQYSRSVCLGEVKARVGSAFLRKHLDLLN
jgi:putative glycosyltransferase (TIGR04372 family)